MTTNQLEVWPWNRHHLTGMRDVNQASIHDIERIRVTIPWSSYGGLDSQVDL